MKVIISLSGGIDSTTVLAWALARGYEVMPVSFYYASKHNRYENEAAKQVTTYYGLENDLSFINLSEMMHLFKSDLLLTGGAIPEGYYEDKSMAQTVVPARNMIFLSILAGIAESQEAEAIAFGAHQGDHAIYPDCRIEFYKAVDLTIFLATGGKVQTLAPFIETDKTGIVKWGLKHDVPFHLTRTCYKSQELACGVCGACRERLEAFRLNNTQDPVKYAKD